MSSMTAVGASKVVLAGTTASGREATWDVGVGVLRLRLKMPIGAAPGDSGSFNYWNWQGKRCIPWPLPSGATALDRDGPQSVDREAVVVSGAERDRVGERAGEDERAGRQRVAVSL